MTAEFANTSRPSIAIRAALFAAVWLIVAGAEPSAWLLGVPAVIAAAWASTRLSPKAAVGFSLIGAVRFATFFLAESLLGGLDVSRRTLGRKLRVCPGFVDYECRLPAGRPLLLFANCVSLLPGTLTAEVHGRRLCLHLLDTQAPVEADLRRLEDRIAELFALRLEGAHA